MEWISVRDRLPRKNDVVDLWADGKRLANYVMTKRGKFEPIMGGISIVLTIDSRYSKSYTCASHWMPLPEPPKDDK